MGARREALSAKLRPDARGYFPWENFFEIFKQGQEDEQLHNIIGTVKHVSIDQALQLIRDKIRGRLTTGPSELRRTFQFFDRDGSGAIDLEEFTNALKLRCGLQFEEGLLKGLIDQWDTERTGELNFANFCAMVMDSKTTDSTTFGGHLKATKRESEQFIRRKVRQSWKELIMVFKRAAVGGEIPVEDFREILQRTAEVRLIDEQFEELLTAISKLGGNSAASQHVGDTDLEGHHGKVKYKAFLKLYGKGSSFDKQVISTIRGVTVAQALDMIREKVRGRLSTGPSELRRTWQFFDSGGKGTITLKEFAKALRLRCGLQFEESLLGRLMDQFDPEKSGSLDFKKFSAMVLDSKNELVVGISDRAIMERASDDNSNSAQFIRRHVRDQWKDLIRAFKHAADVSPPPHPEALCPAPLSGKNFGTVFGFLMGGF